MLGADVDHVKFTGLGGLLQRGFHLGGTSDAGGGVMHDGGAGIEPVLQRGNLDLGDTGFEAADVVVRRLLQGRATIKQLQAGRGDQQYGQG